MQKANIISYIQIRWYGVYVKRDYDRYDTSIKDDLSLDTKVGMEFMSTLLVLLGYEHNYIVHAFLYATEKFKVRTPKIGIAQGRGKYNLQRLQLSTSQITDVWIPILSVVGMSME